jgi:hypothetical protein
VCTQMPTCFVRRRMPSEQASLHCPLCSRGQLDEEFGLWRSRAFRSPGTIRTPNVQSGGSCRIHLAMAKASIRIGTCAFVAAGWERSLYPKNVASPLLSEPAELILGRAFSGSLSRHVGYGNWLLHLFARYVLASWSSGRSPSAWSLVASSRV